MEQTYYYPTYGWIQLQEDRTWIDTIEDFIDWLLGEE
jgi:hypothetical protein